jgi:hypothetical protein
MPLQPQFQHKTARGNRVPGSAARSGGEGIKAQRLQSAPGPMAFLEKSFTFGMG